MQLLMEVNVHIKVKFNKQTKFADQKGYTLNLTPDICSSSSLS